MKKGLSIIELMAVILIIGVLASLAIPNLSIMVEQNKVRGAQFNMQSIYNAQKRYKLNDENGWYYIVDAQLSDQAKLDAINRNLSLKIDDPHFSYTIESRGSQNLAYRVTAKRIEGKCSGKKLVLLDTNESVVKEECRGW